MATHKATQTTPPGSPRPHTATQVTVSTPTNNLQPKCQTVYETCICNSSKSTGPAMTTTPRPVESHPSLAIALHGPVHETTTTANQSTAPIAPQSLPQFMRSTWTVEEITQLVQLRSQGLPWSQVSARFLGRSGNACRKRHERHMKGILQRGPVIETRNGRGVIATPVEPIIINPL